MRPPLRLPRKSRWIFVPFVVVVLLAAAWTAFWFHAAAAARSALADWQEEEARAGHSYSCASHGFGGYPFRIEARCDEAAAEVRSPQGSLVIKAKSIAAVSQVYQPTLLVAEISGPLTVGEPGRPTVVAANWLLAQASLRGVPGAPERISLAIDGLRVDRPAAGAAETLFAADRLELHGRLDSASTAAHPIVDLAATLSGAVAPMGGSVGATPFDLDVTAVLSGLKQLDLRPVKVQLQDLQAAGGSLEITNARLHQADTTAIAVGTLGLSPHARLDGTLRLTVAGLEMFLARSGFGRMFQPASSDGATRSLGRLNSLAPIIGGLDRLAPGLGAAAQSNANARNLAGLLSLLGQRTELDGRPAVAVPLRFSDGAAFLGPIPLGQTPSLY
jgi:hypothetical protein